MPLLQIPRELRDHILSLLVLSTAVVAPPESPVNPDDREKLDDIGRRGWSSGGIVLYSKDTQMKGIPTLAINQQLRKETLAVISHLNLPSLRSYKLDVMIVEDTSLWPTWLYVPTTTTMVEEVHVTFRIMGASTRRRCGYSGGDGGPPEIIWAFYNLLERFLLVGPVARQEKRHDKNIKIRHLKLDVRTPDVPAGMIAPDFNQNRLRQLRGRSGINYIKNPKSVISFISSFLGFLNYWKNTRAEMSTAYDKVGKITLMLDGIMVEERLVTEW
ncbi:hypothetical protein IFR05_004800 [Cadophora sp. M221]|nr:hypothetical protein IFR05_004800 [Cadophora sp. M221]